MDAATRLWRRAVQMVGLGRAGTPMTDGGKVRTVQLLYTSMASQIDAVPVMQHYGFASRAHMGCDHVTVSMSGDLGRAIAVGSNDQRYQFPLAEGETAIFDDQVQSYHIARTGLIQTDRFNNTITSSETGFVLHDVNGNTIVTDAAGIHFNSATGITYVNGEIAGSEEGGVGFSFTGTVRTTGDVIAGPAGATVSLLNHTQINGGGSGPSGPPTPGT
jgi:phage gp45-like